MERDVPICWSSKETTFVNNSGKLKLLIVNSKPLLITLSPTLSYSTNSDAITSINVTFQWENSNVHSFLWLPNSRGCVMERWAVGRLQTAHSVWLASSGPRKRTFTGLLFFVPRRRLFHFPRTPSGPVTPKVNVSLVFQVISTKTSSGFVRLNMGIRACIRWWRK